MPKSNKVNLKLEKNIKDLGDVFKIRRIVFIEEQNVTKKLKETNLTLFQSMF